MTEYYHKGPSTMEEIEMRLEIQPTDIGLLIGHKGSNVSKLKEDYGIDILLPPRSEDGNAMIYITLRGDYHNVCASSAS